jgi:hypothetical protein
MYCVEPAILKIPKGEWYCQACSHNNINEEAEVEEQSPTSPSTCFPFYSPILTVKVIRALKALGGGSTVDNVIQWIEQNSEYTSKNPRALKER